MSASHFFIWSGFLILAIACAVIGWFVRNLYIGHKAASHRADRIVVQSLAAQNSQQISNEEYETRLAAFQVWAKSYIEFQEHVAKSESDRIDELNKRLIDLETENKDIAPVKTKDEDEDPFSGPRSWSAQAAAAERGEGIRNA